MTKSHEKPSAGMTGIKVGSTQIKIVGYGCGNDTVPIAVTETKRLMEQLGADVMVGPLSGDEAVSVANYAKSHPNKTFIIGTAGSQDPTMQIAPKNMFRYHGDGAQWNAGIGEIAYKKLGWRKAAIIMDDYSFGWTSGAGMIADFCAIGGQITKRVFPPLNNADYAPFVRQLPPPNRLTGTSGRSAGHVRQPEGVRAGVRQDRPETVHREPLLRASLGNDKVVAPKFVGSYIGGFGNMPGVHNAKVDAYRAFIRAVPEAADRRRLRLQLLHGREGPDPGPDEVRRSRSARSSRPRCRGRSTAGSRSPNGGKVKLDSRRQAIQDQYQLQLVKNADGSVGPTVIAYVPGVDQSFGGLFKPTSPPPGRTQPPCKKLKTPWQGKIKVVTNGKITNQVIK